MLLKVKNLTIETKDTNKKIVSNSNFYLKKGNTLGIIGESGSGKTMTSKALMGLLNLHTFKVSGSINFNGQELNNLSEKKFRSLRGSQIAMIMQNPMTAFAPMIKIGKQILDTLMVHKMQSKQQLYNTSIKALKSVNLTNAKKLMNSYPHELSGGMLQRIMIVLTMLLNPKIIIADEATTAVDTISEQLIIKEFKKIQQNGVSMIVVTHDFGFAATLCDDIIVMKDGEIIEKGKIRDVFHSPQHPYTKKLVSASILSGGVPC